MLWYVHFGASLSHVDAAKRLISAARWGSGEEIMNEQPALTLSSLMLENFLLRSRCKNPTICCRDGVDKCLVKLVPGEGWVVQM